MSKPIVPWMGGKRKLIDHILPLFPEHTCYVEPFAGGAAVFFAKQPSDCDVLNDINGELVNLYRVVKHHIHPLFDELKWMLSSRQQFDWFKQADPAAMTDIQRAARFIYLQKASFGAMGSNYGTVTTGRAKFNIYNLERDLQDAHFRIATTHLENMDWAALIERYDRPHTLFYSDPPYWETHGYGVEFGWENYQKISDLAQSIQGTMFISHNHHEKIRELFDWAYIKEVDYSYTVGESQNAKKDTELIICNKPFKSQGQDPLF